MRFIAFSIAALIVAGTTPFLQQVSQPSPSTEALPSPDGVPVQLIWRDLDGDGLLDAIVLSNAGPLQWLRNTGGGTLQDATPGAGLANLFGVSSVAIGDFDGDERSDLFLVSASRGCRLLRQAENCSFEDITIDAGMPSSSLAREARWLDFDMDGRLDLHLAGGPSERLFRNVGGIAFDEVRLGIEIQGTAGMRTNAPDWGVPLDSPTSSMKTAADDLAPANSSGRQPALSGPSGTSMPAGTASPTSPPTNAVACSLAVEDLANPGVCLNASSVPVLGALYPISPEFYVDASTGRVGLGTTSPNTRLHVGGRIFAEATTGPALDARNTGNGAILLGRNSAGEVFKVQNAGGIVSTTDATGLTGAALYANNTSAAGGNAIFGHTSGSGTTAYFTQDGTGAILRCKSDADIVFTVKNAGGITSTTSATGQTDAALYASNTSAGEGVAIYAETVGTGTTAHFIQSGTDAIVRARNSAGEVFKIRNAGGIVSTTEATGLANAALYAINTNVAGGNAIFGETSGTSTTAYFRQNGTGNILKGENTSGAVFTVTNTGRVVTTALQITGGGDLVEGFESTGAKLEAGMVAIIDPEHPGQLAVSECAYDRKVAGVVSGAGGIQHGIRMGQDDVLDGETLLAMSGRVYVRCSAENGAIQPGDLLTSAELAGHAMKATDAGKSFGSVIGKAMGDLEEGTGLVLVLVNLQ